MKRVIKSSSNFEGIPMEWLDKAITNSYRRVLDTYDSELLNKLQPFEVANIMYDKLLAVEAFEYCQEHGINQGEFEEAISKFEQPIKSKLEGMLNQ